MTDKVHIQQTKRSNASKMENETKSKKTGDRKRKIDEIHNDLRHDLAFEHLDGQSSKKFRGAAWKHLNHADRSYTEPFEILDRLESTGNFAPGKYGLVREIGEKIEEKSFVEAINEAEKRIANIDAEDDDQPKPRNDKITNIIGQTKKELEDHLFDSSYVPLHVVDHIKKVLHRKGLVVLVGPRGCGKSKSVLQILSKVKKGRVLKLKSLHDWPEMVQVAFENWVWFDDVFEKDPVDKNRSVMATISACVTDKRTKVLFTVVSEVFEQYRFILDRFLSAESIINFSDPQYELTLEMKYEILHAHLSANDITIRHGLRPSGHASPVSDEDAKYIYEDDAQEIPLKRPICGFPQSCNIFCKNPTFLLRGHKFFDDPPKELLQVLKNMLSSKGEQFVILLYAFKNSGQIDLNFLNKHQMSILFNEVSVPLPRIIESCIRKHIEDLRGKFLVERNLDIFEFPHSSIQRAVALSYSKLSKRAKLEVISMLSTTTIVDLVKPRSESDHVDSSVINVSRESYSDLADLFTQRITEGDLALFKCSVFHNEEFISMFVNSYLESSEKSISSQLRFIFRYGMINLAKAVLVAWHSTVDDLKDNDYESFMKESSIHRHSTAVQYLINERQESFQKTTSMIECLECSIRNDEITSILVRNLSVTKLDNTQEKAILKVVTRNESLTSFQFFIETAGMQSEMLGYVADLAGRRNAHNCINFLLERYSSDMNDIIIDSTRGACKGGHDQLIDWAIEHFPELIKNKAADFLLHVELPSTLEKLLLRYNSVISKLEFSETLNTLCGKGKSLCVKVLLDRCDLFSEPDIQNAMRAAVKKGHLKTVNVIMETFSVPHDMVSELIETVRQSDNMKPHSAYPFTPAQTPASVQSKNMFTPSSYEQSEKRHTKTLRLKRSKSNGYLYEEGNVYRRAYQTLSTILDNNKDRESKLHQCEELIKSIPEKYEDLIMESALHSLHDEELFSIFLMKYSTIWKAIFSACRNDRKQIENLIKSTMKHYRCRGQPFLPSLIDFAIQNNENILDFIDLLIETQCTFDVEEFNSTLSSLIVTHKEIAKILVQNVEEMTLENSVFLPLTMCCRSHQIDVFKFIWDNISYQKDVFLDLMSKDIMDQDGKALYIMLPDITRYTSYTEIFLKCFQKHSRKWISKLRSTHKQELLNSTESIKSVLFTENDPASLALLIQNVNIGRKESNNLLIQACRKGWKNVIQAVLYKEEKIAGGILLKSIESLIRTNHHDLLHCFQSSLNECNVTPPQSKKILDIIITNCGASDTIPTILQSLILRPCFAAHVSSDNFAIISPLLSNDALNSTEYIKSELMKENDSASLALLIRHLDIGHGESTLIKNPHFGRDKTQMSYMHQVLERLKNKKPKTQFIICKTGGDFQKHVILGYNTSVPQNKSIITTEEEIEINEKNPYNVNDEASFLNNWNIRMKRTRQIDTHRELIRQCIKDNAPRLWREHSNLTIITGDSVKSSNNTQNLEPCIVLYCISKGFIPIYEEHFPKELSCHMGTIKTDVREGYFTLGPTHLKGDLDSYNDPICMGSNIEGSRMNASGSLGLFVDLPNNERGFITCCHVLFDCIKPECFSYEQTGSSFHYVIQPGNTTFCRRTDTICGEVRKAKFWPGDCARNVDAALVKVSTRMSSTGHFVIKNTTQAKELGYAQDTFPVFDTGKVRRIIAGDDIEKPLLKSGTTTGLTRSFFRLDGMQVRIFKDGAWLGTESQDLIIMKEQIEVEAGLINKQFFAPGDSGSAVFIKDPDGKLSCIGIAIGLTSYGTTVVTPIGPVLDSLDLKDGDVTHFK